MHGWFGEPLLEGEFEARFHANFHYSKPPSGIESRELFRAGYRQEHRLIAVGRLDAGAAEQTF